MRRPHCLDGARTEALASAIEGDEGGKEDGDKQAAWNLGTRARGEFQASCWVHALAKWKDIKTIAETTAREAAKEGTRGASPNMEPGVGRLRPPTTPARGACTRRAPAYKL